MYSNLTYSDMLINNDLNIYGYWARDNLNCIEKSTITYPFIKLLQLFMSLFSLFQIIFMFSKIPNIPWEAIYLPATEIVSYTLSYFGEGYILLASGKLLPWSRMATWICTCPIMLNMISNIETVKYNNFPLNNFMIPASLIRTVFGLTASMSTSYYIILINIFFSFIFFIFELSCVFYIYKIAIQNFLNINSSLSLKIVKRLKLLRFIFFLTWNSFWIIWILSSTFTCTISENISSILYLLSDLFCKNIYGLILWNTTYVLLNGKWDKEKHQHMLYVYFEVLDYMYVI